MSCTHVHSYNPCNIHTYNRHTHARAHTHKNTHTHTRAHTNAQVLFKALLALLLASAGAEAAFVSDFFRGDNVDEVCELFMPFFSIALSRVRLHYFDVVLCTHSHTPECICVLTYAHTYIHAACMQCIHAYIIHACMHACMHAYVHTYIMHACMHAYVHTHIQVLKLFKPALAVLEDELRLYVEQCHCALSLLLMIRVAQVFI